MRHRLRYFVALSCLGVALALAGCATGPTILAGTVTYDLNCPARVTGGMQGVDIWVYAEDLGTKSRAALPDYSTISGSDGSYTFELPPGQYKIRFYFNGATWPGSCTGPFNVLFTGCFSSYVDGTAQPNVTADTVYFEVDAHATKTIDVLLTNQPL